MPTNDHDMPATRPDQNQQELLRELDTLRSRVAELEAMVDSSARTEDSFARQKALMQTILRNLPFDFWARDREQKIIMQSDASVRLWGDLSTTAVDEAQVPEEIRQTWKSVNDRVYAGEILEGEKRYTLPSGETRIYRDIVAPIKRGQETLGILGTNIDITDQVHNVGALHRSEANLASLLNSIEESAALFEPDGTIITANQTFADRVGKTVAQCVGASVYDIIPADIALNRKHIVEKILRTGQPVTFEDERCGHWLRHSLSPVFAADGTVAAISTFAMDMTERRRRENLLMARQKLSEYAINHPLKDLLRMALDEAEVVTGSVLGFLHFLDEDQKTLTMQAWSTRTLRTGFRTANTHLLYDIDHAGVWADCVRARRAVIHNDYGILEHRKGLPEGHPALIRQMLLPVIRAEKIVAIVAVGNKPTDYTEADVQALTELGNLLWDILGYKRIQEALAKSETLLSMGQRLSRMGGWEWDVERQVMNWTQEVYQLHGFTQGQLAPDSPDHVERSLACYEAADREVVLQAFKNCAEHGIPYDLELSFTSASGKRMRVQTRGEAIWDGDRVVKVLGTFGDITERWTLEQRYKTLFENMLDGFALHEIICDEHGRAVDYRFLEVNAAFERHTGLSGMDIKGRTVREIFPRIEQVWIETYGRVALTGEPALFEEYSAAQDKYFQVSAFRPAPMQFACIFSDISQRKQHERELSQARDAAEAANVAKSEFLANMSHEIRTPLNGILGILQLFESMDLSEDHKKLIGLAATSAGRLSELLSDLLDLSRIESGKLVFEERPFELEELRSSTLGIFALAARNKNLELEFDLSPDLTSAFVGDESRLRQVLFNLVGNSIKFTHTGSVRIEVSPLPFTLKLSRILVCVTDTGSGIPDGRLDDIFKPFVQGEESYVRHHQGAGLGLAIVKRLVNMMGGCLCIENAQEGTTICFSLPLQPFHPLTTPAELPKSGSAQPLTGLKILLVEDDAVSMFAARRVLEKAGHLVTGATDGSQVLEILRSGDFDLILMDVQLPVMDGVQATTLIRSDPALGDKARIPIIAMTAYAMSGDREKFLAAGMNDYIAKPVSAAELTNILNRTGLCPS